MHFFAFSLLLFSTTLPVFGHLKVEEEPPTRSLNLYSEQTPSYKISECVFVTSEETHYSYEASSDSKDICGVYIFTDPDKAALISFDRFDVPCERGGLLSYVDGWELNGELFPGIRDHEKPLSERFRDFCGSERPESTFLTSQNAGMLHYRLPSKGTGFSFYVKFVKLPMPCNVLVEDHSGIYTLKNYGRTVNCSLMALFPAKINILALDVGVTGLSSLLQKETTTIFQASPSFPTINSSDGFPKLRCKENGKGDFLEIGGSEGLDLSNLVSYLDFCGSDYGPGREVSVGCGVTAVKLVSSGKYLNSATFALAQAEDEDLAEASLVCSV